MKNLLIFCFFTSTLILGCVNKNDKQTERLLKEYNMDIDTLKHYLKLQEKSPYVDDYDSFSEDDMYMATIEDIELTLPFIKNELNKNNYQELDSSTFYSKIEMIFQNTINSSNKENDLVLLLSANKKNISQQSLENEDIYHFDSGNFFISRKNKFILMPTFLNKFISIDQDQLIYKKVPEELIALNLYLLNDRKAYFHILANTESYAEEKGFLLKKLFYAFLYHNDDKLNDWIFINAKTNVYDNNPNTFEPFKYIFSKEKDCLFINKKLIDTIIRLTNEDDCYFFNLFGYYIYDIIGNKVSNSYTQEDKATIVKTLVELEYPLREKYTKGGYNNDWGKYSFSSAIIANYPQLYDVIQKKYNNNRELQDMLSELIDESNGVV